MRLCYQMPRCSSSLQQIPSTHDGDIDVPSLSQWPALLPVQAPYRGFSRCVTQLMQVRGCHGLSLWYTTNLTFSLRWSWLEVSDRQSALTPPYLTRPSLTHRAASQQAQRWHFLEKRVRCQQQYVSFHIVTVSVGGLEEGESERKIGKVASVLPVTFCHTSLFISAFLWGGKIAENKHKGSFSKPADWLLKRSDSRNVEAINEHWKTNYPFNRTV